MKRLFLLSMAVVGAGVLFCIALGVLIDELTSSNLGSFAVGGPDLAVVILTIPFIIIGCAGVITLGVMLVKHVRDIFRK